MVSITSSMRSPSFSVSTRPFMWNSIGSEAMARNWSATVSRPSSDLAAGFRLLCELDVEHRRAAGLARQFAGRKRDHGRQHPRLHLGDAGGRNAALVERLWKPPRHPRATSARQRRAVGEHHQFRLGGDRGHHLGLVEDFGGFDDHRIGGVEGASAPPASAASRAGRSCASCRTGRTAFRRPFPASTAGPCRSAWRRLRF